MTRNEQLLLSDVTARLATGIMIQHNGVDVWLDYKTPSLQERLTKLDFKPYLFPVSTLTPMQYAELNKWFAGRLEFYQYSFLTAMSEISIDNVMYVINWLNQHRIDYNDLFSKGLALKATKEMYQ